MKKYRRQMVLFGVCAIMLTACGTSKSDNKSENSIDRYVDLGPGVKAEMLSEEFWLENTSVDNNELILDMEQIAKINESNREMLTTDSGYQTALLDVEEEIDAAFVKEMMAVYKVPEEPELVFANGTATTKQYWEDVVENGNEVAVKENSQVSVRFGFCVRRSDVKALPTEDFIGESADEYHYDQNARAECTAFSPVAVLSESLDGEWYYILCDSYAGWIKKERIALCESREEWVKRQTFSEYLVVTGRELRLVSDPYSPETSELLLPMGTVLPLISLEDAPDDFDGRQSYGNYIVKVPVRLENGMIGDSYVLIPVSEDVSKGYLPYTRENLLNLLFKRQGDRYGWAGMYYANDCSGIMREVYGCFGFEFPRSARAQIAMSDMEYLDFSEMNEEEKLEALSKVPAGTLLYFPGHIMAYLGMVDDVPYVISSVGSWATKEMAEGEAMPVNTVAVNSLTDTTRKNGQTWLENITDVLVCE